VPLSLAALPALLVEAAGQVCALPLEAVVRAMAVPGDRLTRVGDRVSVVAPDGALPFLSLAEALEAEPGPAPESWTAVRIRAGDREAALGVDRVLGTTEVVVRPLPALVGSLPLVSGASFDAEGVPQPLLDPWGLVEAAGRYAERPAAAPPPGRVLVVDDSLTTRMLEQTVLEAAGYHVTLAASALEALEVARRQAFDLFIVDVEMPGMSGFEFVEATRHDGPLGRIPAILVTSRDTEADRRRGAEAGASAYIVKGEFEQSRFLATVGSLVRRP
jgi:two-component system chemotaxis sensor kinase CheA